MHEFFWASLYRLSIPLARLFPRCLAIKVAELIGFLYYLLAERSRTFTRENLKQILGKDFKEKYVFRTFMNFSFYLVDFMRIGNENKGFFKRYIKIENIEVLEEAFRRSSSGVIGLSMHLGNWEIGGGYLNYLGYKISAVALDHSVKYIDKFFKLQRKRLGIDELPFKDSLELCLERLKEKRILALLGDRDFTRKFIKRELFGRPYYLPKAPYLLMLRAKVPVVFGVMVREGYSYRLTCEGPFLPNSLKLNKIEEITDKILCIMEKYIKLYPDQWFLFRRYWEEPKEVVII